MDKRSGRMNRVPHDQPEPNSLPASVLRGVAVAFLVALVASAVVAVVLAFTPELKVSHSTLLLLNYLSVLTGGLVGGKAARRRGWLVGLLIGVIYALIILAFSQIQGQPLVATLQGLLITALLGLLAGTVGVNF